jgi:hypothetical protein
MHSLVGLAVRLYRINKIVSNVVAAALNQQSCVPYVLTAMVTSVKHL